MSTLSCDYGTGIKEDPPSRKRGPRFVAVLAALLVSSGIASGQTVTTGPSTFCHAVDGVFTSCMGGGTEWSDITGITFGTSFGLNVVYTEMNSTQDHFFFDQISTTLIVKKPF